MKKLLLKTVFVIMITAFLFITGCNNDVNDGLDDCIISDDTVVLEEEDVENVIEEIAPVNGDPANGYDVTIPSESDLADSLAVGNILVCGSSEKLPGGMLQKIESIDSAGDSTLFHTVPAALNEAFEEMHMDYSFDLDPEDIVKSVPLIDGVTFTPGNRSDSSASRFALNYGFDVILAQYAGATLTLSGNASLEVTSELKIDIGFFKINNIKYKINVDESVQLEVIASYDLALEKEIEVYKHYFAPRVYFAGPVPIVLEPVVTICVGISGEISMSASAGIVHTGHIDSSISWDSGSGDWSFEKDSFSDFYPIFPSANLECTVTASAGPNLDVLLYGLIGPCFGASGYLTLTVDLTTAPPLPDAWLTLDAGVEASIGY